MYALLCNYASDNDRCWPSQAKLAARLSCSVSSVKKYLAELVGIKLVHVRREQYRSSVYYMLEPAHMKGNSSEATKSDSQAAKPTCRQADSACPQPKVGYINTLNKQREIQNPPLPPVPQMPPKVVPTPTRPAAGGGGSFLHDFEKAWELYPKKEAKGLARVAWQHLKRMGQLPALTELEASIRHFMSTENWQREQGRFVPQMGNWLKGQRWLDTSAPVAAVTTQEAAKTQQAVSAAQAMQVQHEADKARRKDELETLRPTFAAFAAKFHEKESPWHMPMAFGLWAYLHGKHMAPTPADVPDDNSLGIVAFLQAFKRRCEEAAWQQAHAHNPALNSFAGQYAAKAAPHNDTSLHHPLFSRRPPQEAFGRAV